MKILTKDLYEAAFLLTQGGCITKILAGRNSVLLQFEGSEKLGELKLLYNEGSAEVNLHDLRKRMREVKDIVFSTMRETKGEKVTSFQV